MALYYCQSEHLGQTYPIQQAAVAVAVELDKGLLNMEVGHLKNTMLMVTTY